MFSADISKYKDSVNVWNTVKQSLIHSPEDARRQTTRGLAGAAIMSIVFYLLVLTRGRPYCSANVVSAGYSKFCLSPLI